MEDKVVGMMKENERDSVERFSDRAADYVKYRPAYPREAIDAILADLGPPERVVAADVGAGTGISARLLGDRGVRVVAVEPGEDMRRAAAPHANVEWVNGRAEATGLRSASCDLILCAQSFHWFHPADVLPEFARIVKPGRRLAIMWNRRSESDGLTVGYRQAIVDVVGDLAAERMSFDSDAIARSGLFSPPERTSVPSFQRFDLEGLLGRARSASYVPKTGVEAERLMELLRSLHARYADANGEVTLIYETEVFRSSKL